MKAAVVYFSETGNTEAMARAVLKGAQEAGAEATLLTSAEFTAAMAADCGAIALGCPASGSEELEQSEFEPLFAEMACGLAGKKVALFGSYGWGGGEWMRQWEERCGAEGLTLAADSVICMGPPDEETLENCRRLGRSLVRA